MKTQSVKNFFISPFTIYKKDDPNTSIGKITTWEKVLLVAFSILLIPTVVGAPACLLLGSALARRRNAKDLTQTFEQKDLKIGVKTIFSKSRSDQKEALEKNLLPPVLYLKEWLSNSPSFTPKLSSSPSFTPNLPPNNELFYFSFESGSFTIELDHMKDNLPKRIADVILSTKILIDEQVFSLGDHFKAESRSTKNEENKFHSFIFFTLKSEELLL